MLEELKQEVYEANMMLPKLGIVTFTWGNVSGIDREKNLFVIKPSGVPYEDLKPSDMVVVDLEGHVVEGDMNPSSDTMTHLVLYKAFPNIKAVVRTFKEYGIDPDAVPAVLVKQHGPFTWGPSPKKAVENAKILDVVAEMNYHALQLTRADIRVPQFLLDKHYYRKHGANAYYGQNNAKSKSGVTHK